MYLGVRRCFGASAQGFTSLWGALRGALLGVFSVVYCTTFFFFFFQLLAGQEFGRQEVGGIQRYQKGIAGLPVLALAAHVLAFAIVSWHRVQWLANYKAQDFVTSRSHSQRPLCLSTSIAEWHEHKDYLSDF